MVSRSALPSGDAGPENFGMTISLVTGANKGIGFEIARGIGGTVLVGARDDTRGRAAETALREAGVDAHHLRLDVTDQEHLDRLPAAAKLLDVALEGWQRSAGLGPPRARAAADTTWTGNDGVTGKASFDVKPATGADSGFVATASAEMTEAAVR